MKATKKFKILLKITDVSEFGIIRIATHTKCLHIVKKVMCSLKVTYPETTLFSCFNVYGLFTALCSFNITLKTVLRLSSPVCFRSVRVVVPYLD